MSPQINQLLTTDMNIGQAIKTLRLKQGMTQLQLADRCGISDQGISNIETGRTLPPKSTVEKLCQVFGIPTSYLLLASIEEDDIPEEKRVLYRALLEPLRNELLEKGDIEDWPSETQREA